MIMNNKVVLYTPEIYYLVHTAYTCEPVLISYYHMRVYCTTR